MARKPAPPCPCGSGQPFAGCCQPIIAGERPAPSAEALMRSRYSAYATGARAWLLASWHPTTRPATLALDEPLKWIGLTVHEHRQQDATQATVRFVARYRLNGRAHRLSETSRFVCEAGQWLYVEGELEADEGP